MKPKKKQHIPGKKETLLGFVGIIELNLELESLNSSLTRPEEYACKKIIKSKIMERCNCKNSIIAESVNASKLYARCSLWTLENY